MYDLRTSQTFDRDLECFPPLRMYWFKNRRIHAVGYHVTPYVKEILSSGYIYPPQKTKVETLGSPYADNISFASKLSDAKELARSLALCALLYKGLMSISEFKAWLISNYDVKFEYNVDTPSQEGYIMGILTRNDLSESQLRSGSWVEPYFKKQDNLLEKNEFYKMQAIINLFQDLKHIVGFVDPVIITSEWINNLPDNRKGLLECIGIFKCELSAKALVDPSLGYICYGGYYGTENAEGAKLLGLNWEDLWSHEYGTGESMDGITSNYWKILDVLNDLQHFDKSRVLKGSDEDVLFKLYQRELPYDFSEYGTTVGEVPVNYCQDVLLYFCQEGEFAVFSSGVSVTRRNLCVSSASL